MGKSDRPDRKNIAGTDVLLPLGLSIVLLFSVVINQETYLKKVLNGVPEKPGVIHAPSIGIDIPEQSTANMTSVAQINTDKASAVVKKKKISRHIAQLKPGVQARHKQNKSS